MSKLANKKICLALQGGGAYGAFTWGILDKFLEAECFEIDAISATSSGGVNAIILAHALTVGSYKDARASLYDLWRTISELGEKHSPLRENPIENLMGYDFTYQLTFHLYDTLTRIYSPYILNPLNYNPLRIMLEQKIDFDQLHKENKIKIFLGATNVKTGQLRIFSNKEITVDTVMASACLPDIYQAVEIDNEYYWDGGFLGNPAIFPLLYNSNVDDVVIISTNPFVRSALPITSSEIENRLNEISFNSSLLRELRVIGYLTKMIDEGYIKDEFKDKIRRKFMHLVSSDSVMNRYQLRNKYKWHWDSLQELRDLGRMVAKEWLERNFESIGVKSSLNFDNYL